MAMADPMEVALPGHPMKCVAHNRSGGPCKRFATKGTTVCHLHGSAAPQTKNAARRRLGVYNVGQLMEKHLHATEEPAEALMTELYRSCVLVETYQALVNALEVDPDNGEAFYGPDHQGNLASHEWVKLLADERKMKAQLAKMALDAGLAERAVRVKEAQAVLLSQIVGAALDAPELNLTVEQRLTARRLVAEEARKALPKGE